MSIVLDTHSGGDKGSTSSSTVTATMTVSAGDLIVVGATWGNSGTHTATCADNKNAGNYPVAVSSVNDTNLGQISQMWYFANAAAGSTMITVTTSAAQTFLAMVAACFSGAKTDSTVLGPGSNTGNGTGSGTYTGGSITPVNNGALIFSCLTYGNAITGAGSGFTLLDNDTSTGEASEYEIQATAAAISPTWNAGSNSQFWRILSCAFYASTGGATTPTYGTPRLLMGIGT